MNDSRKLLEDYAKRGSEAAFRELVARYVSMVHSTALRLVHGDSHLAEDVTQTVFLNLARKAGTLSGEVMIGGWLHRNACFVAQTMMRGDRRRQNRERQAVEMNATEDHSAAKLAMVAPLLDEAINQLGPEDRTAILLRFFEQQEFRAVGEIMGSNEDAARMRVNRALDKLHEMLKQRGVVFSAAALGVALAAEAVTAAPIGMAASVATAALGGAATGGATLTIAKIMSMTQVKIAIASAIAVAALAVPVVVQHQSVAKLRRENQMLQQQAAQLAPLQAENQRLSNLVAQPNARPAPAEQQMRELARLRDEVGRLRQQSNDVANLQARMARIGQLNRARTGMGGGGRVFHNITMSEFAKFMGGVLQAPVADQTGLTGAYDIEMTPPRPGGVDRMLERVTGILHDELGLQLIAFAGPFTTEEEKFDRELLVIRHADGTYTQLSNGTYMPKADGLYAELPDGTFTNVAPSSSVPMGGFALRLDHPGAPGLKPAAGELGPKTGLYDADTQGLPGEIANKLILIDAAKEQWALEKKKQNTDTPTWQEIRLYLGRAPNGNMSDYTNSSDGNYIIGSVGGKSLLRLSPAAEAAWKSVGTLAPKGPTSADQNECISNLRRIDGAKGQWALENRKQNTDTPTMEDLKKYMGRGRDGELPACPDGGVYTPGKVGEKPSCSIPGHVLP